MVVVLPVLAASFVVLPRSEWFAAPRLSRAVTVPCMNIHGIDARRTVDSESETYAFAQPKKASPQVAKKWPAMEMGVGSAATNAPGRDRGRRFSLVDEFILSTQAGNPSGGEEMAD
jgi:hypothetical protein